MPTIVLNKKSISQHKNTKTSYMSQEITKNMCERKKKAFTCPGFYLFVRVKMSF
jgi:hypothetical protein